MSCMSTMCCRSDEFGIPDVDKPQLFRDYDGVGAKSEKNE